MKLIAKIIRISTVINLGVIIPLVLFTLITSKTSVINGITSFVVLTGSMQPAIPTGSVIYTKRQPSYATGDIVAFKNGVTTITHRIVNVTSKDDKKFYTTKGDANNAPDNKKVGTSEILGKQLVFVPFVGRAVIFVQTPFGFFYSIIFPIVVFVILEFWNLKKEIEKEAEKKFRKRMQFANDHPSLFSNKQVA